MSRYLIMMALACAAAAGCTAPPASTRTAQTRAGGAVWGQATEVPGLGALNASKTAEVTSVSCASAGNCTAGGFYGARSGHSEAFVASQVNGRWGAAIEVPGTAAPNTDAQVLSVSCASAGNCTVGGFYAGRYYAGGPSSRFYHTRLSEAFVAIQVNGRWGAAIEVPGTAALNADKVAGVNSVSCASAGNCTAGGSYKSLHGRPQAFVASQVNGRWGTAIEVPGTAALNVGGMAGVVSVSCASPGNCTAGGSYNDGSGPGHSQAFVASQRNGRWGTAIEVPGTATLNGQAGVSSVSCASAGNCTAGGGYTDSSGKGQAFVASQRNGRWGTAIEVPGTPALNAGGNAVVSSVSCASAGNCAAGGYYTQPNGDPLAFVASQRNGRWGTAIEVPGTAAGRSAEVLSVSCASPGNCAAGGDYADRSGRTHAFVASQRNGRWGTAIEVLGTAALNAGGYVGYVIIRSLSCASPGNCTAGGNYADTAGRSQGFVASRP
jgi:hypothetical protein